MLLSCKYNILNTTLVHENITCFNELAFLSSDSYYIRTNADEDTVM